MCAVKRATAHWRGGCTLGAMPSSGQGGSHWCACLDTPGDEAVAAGASTRAIRLAIQLAGPRVGPINAACGRARARQLAVEGQTPGAMARAACEAISTGAQRSRQVHDACHQAGDPAGEAMRGATQRRARPNAIWATSVQRGGGTDVIDFMRDVTRPGQKSSKAVGTDLIDFKRDVTRPGPKSCKAVQRCMPSRWRPCNGGADVR